MPLCLWMVASMLEDRGQDEVDMGNSVDRMPVLQMPNNLLMKV